MKSRSTFGLALILGGYLCIGLWFAIANPIFESPDENLHFAYMRYLKQTQALPVYVGEIFPMRQQISQPPLYYALGALVISGVDTSDFEQFAKPNPHTSLGRADLIGNRNVFVRDPDEMHWQGTVLAVWLVRGLGVLLGAMVILCTYWSAQFFVSPSLALIAAAINAFTPGFIFIAASVNNDIFTALTGSLTLALLLWSWQQQWKWPTLIPLGMAMGLAANAKLNALGVIPLTSLAVVVGLMQTHGGRQWRRWLPAAAHVLVILGAVTFVVGAGWYLRNFWLYGDPLASKLHFDIMTPKTEAPSLNQMLFMLDGVFKSWWGVFGWIDVIYPIEVYWTASVVSVVALVGLLWLIVRERRLEDVLMLIWFLTFLVELIGWGFFRNLQGRLLFPAISAISIGLMRGLGVFLPERWRTTGLTLFCAALVLLSAVAPEVIIRPTYAATPPLTASESAALPPKAEIVYADTFTLESYTVPTTVYAGEHLTVTLYWSAEASPATDYSVFVQLLDPDGVLLLSHDSYPDNGARPTSAMRPGVVYVDTHTLVLPVDLAACRCSLIVGLYDVTTQTRLPLTLDGQPQAVLVLGPVEVLNDR